MRILLKGFVCAGDFQSVSRRSVLIENDRIIAVEKEIYGSCAAERCIEFKDEIIAPGFIDAHGHSDVSALAAPECFTKISQGICAEICGNCGLSPFPITGMNREHLVELYSSYPVEITWDDLKSYQKKCDETASAMKLFPLTGHNTLRAAIAGYEPGELSGRQMDEMCRLLAGELSGGSPGLSSGLLYVPGIFATADEIAALMKTVAKFDKVYTTHLRSEGSGLLESLEETLQLAGRAGLKKVLISHFKTAGSSNFHKLAPALEMIREYRRQGMDVRFDRYPYIESQTMLSVVLGEAYSSYGDRELSGLLASPEERARAVAHLNDIRDENYWRSRRLAGTSHPKYQKFQGKFFSDIPGESSQCVIDILSRCASDSTVAAAGMSEENMLKIITAPEAFFGSDGNALPPDSRFGRPHPRSSGGAAKFARLLLDHGIAIEQICWKLAGSTAEFFSLENRGSIRPGNYADITVFSPEEIDSKADFADPFCPASGIPLVIASGKIYCF